MIYSAGKNCPICIDFSDIIFLKSVISDEIFFACYSCGCADDCLPNDENGQCYSPLDLAPEGFALATLADIECASLVSLIVEEFSADDLLFDGDEGFVSPDRNLQDYDGKTIAVTLATPCTYGEQEQDWGVLIGRLGYENGKLILDIDSAPKEFEIKREWLCHIKPMYSGMRPRYSEAELTLSLARSGTFPCDTPPNEIMEIAKKRYAKTVSV